MTDLSNHSELELGTDNEDVRASTADAAAGLANARENRKMSNNAVGNNQIAMHGVRSALAMRQKLLKENYN